MKTATAKTHRSTKTEKSVAQERSMAAKSVAQSEVQPGPSRAASQVEATGGAPLSWQRVVVSKWLSEESIVTCLDAIL